MRAYSATVGSSRNKPHPVVFLAGSAALLVYLPWKAAVFLVLLVVWCAAGFRALFCRSSRFMHAAYWLALGLGLWAGLLDYSYHSCAVPQCALPPGKLRGAVLSVAGDPSPTKSGNTMVPVRLTALTGDDGLRVSARGALQLVVAGSWSAARGTLVHVPATAEAFEKGFLYAPTNKVLIIKNAPPLDSFRLRARSALMAALDRSAGKASPLVKALVVGYRGELDAESVRVFTDAGCAHILALSGQHVAVLVCMVGALARILSGKRGEFAVCIAGLAFFAWLTGASPSVVRAVLQYGLAGVFVKMDRPQSGLVVLGYTFWLTCFLFPGSPRTLSFELSYLAVAGILVLAEPASFFLKKYLPRCAAKALGLGLGAMAGTSLLCALVFGSVNLLAPITSALLGPLITLLIWIGICGAVLVGAVPALVVVSRPVAEFTERAVLFLVKAGSPGFRAGGPSFVAGFSVVAIAGFVLYCYVRGRTRRARFEKDFNEKTYQGRTRKPVYRSLKNLRAAR